MASLVACVPGAVGSAPGSVAGSAAPVAAAVAWLFAFTLEPLEPALGTLVPEPVSVGGAARVVMPPVSDFEPELCGADAELEPEGEDGVFVDGAAGAELEFSEVAVGFAPFDEGGALDTAGDDPVSLPRAWATAPSAPGVSRGPSVAPAPEAVGSDAPDELAADDALVPEVVEES